MALMQASYIALYRSGELARRVARLEARLASCDLCPRECRVNRLENETGYCHSGRLPIVSSYCAHHGEEPVLSGSRGSGTIFFGNCNMRCVYCQNYQISQDWQRQRAKEVTCRTLSHQMLHLQDLGCHNINFVSPSHFIPQIVRAILDAVPLGLNVPLVYNTGGYDTISAMAELEGIIDIYLPDLRYASEEWAKRFSHAPDYVANARQSIKEMYRQVGDLVVDEAGVAERGLIVRHLVLPHEIAGSRESLTWLAHDVSPAITLSIMAQYMPLHRARQFPELARTITKGEYQTVVQLLDDLGLENGWVQELGAEANYLPDFHREGHPFAPPRVPAPNSNI
ncbi:MAG: radical SAM protein [Chloroflexi bacterium]|nr:radical SAM protein [Chloroflexota bacterium]